MLGINELALISRWNKMADILQRRFFNAFYEIFAIKSVQFIFSTTYNTAVSDDTHSNDTQWSIELFISIHKYPHKDDTKFYAERDINHTSQRR